MHVIFTVGRIADLQRRRVSAFNSQLVLNEIPFFLFQTLMNRNTEKTFLKDFKMISQIRDGTRVAIQNLIPFTVSEHFIWTVQ